MRKTVFLLVLMTALGVLPRGWSQNSSDQASVDKEVQESAFRLDFSINELEDGKKINARQYSMNLTAGNYKELKIGTRVNVEAEQGKFQYLDVGTNIRARIYGKREWPILDVTAEVSNFASPEQNNRSSAPPLLRQMVISGTTVLVFGKPVVIGSVDDPNSKRQFQLELTATKLK